MIGIFSSIVMAYTTNFTVFAFFYSLGFGFVAGWAYMIPVHHSWLWFPDHAGLTSGIIIGSFGLGTIIFDAVQKHIVNPNNLQAVNGVFPLEVTTKVPKML